ncbi:kinase-like domain-containing protein [Aspergillus avenaceus]|uniref:non-specific serine/threonine protein kinase n=1 Tax=Aspergillus avenaceus TaxID=36643 RepID=A0A5N6TZW2_ASPAV|nr:kinase-like domain-containing protein [Aspergillus avenaceus]
MSAYLAEYLSGEMAGMKFRTMGPLSILKHRPWPPSPAVAPRLDVNQCFEEENTPYYHSAHFYPTRIGEILNNRYQVVTKIGYGTSSTIWLARDLNQWRCFHDKYVAVKISTTEHHSRQNAAQNELDILRHIARANPHHKGWHFNRHLLDTFTLNHDSRIHLALVSEPLREPLWMYQRRFVGDVIPSGILKVTVQMILEALDYLHSECHIIHTDLKPDNVMVKVEDPSILDESAKDEYQHPLPQKLCPDGHITYLSRNNYGPPQKTAGIITITDFDLAVYGDKPNNGCIQAEIYRAPEVILDAGFSYSADIWSLGVMLWDLLEGRKLFKDVDPVQVQEYSESGHLSHITALLGPAPDALLSNGRRTGRFYTTDGHLKYPTAPPTSFNFEGLLNNIRSEDKTLFIQFIRRMLKWHPEDRSTAKELLQDPWLSADFDDF